MNHQRHFTSIATTTTTAKAHLQGLLDSTQNPIQYREHMTALGKLLGAAAVSACPPASDTTTLVIATAEDADFLQAGVIQALHDRHIDTRLAVFWNHHYQLPNQSSVAPIVHKFIEPDYQQATQIMIVKSVISGSCVVRTNLIEMLTALPKIATIFILAPVAHRDSERKLKAEFPDHISQKFRFICFAIDDERHNGEVIPGIGGQVYQLLGLSDQPALTGYLPKVVEAQLFAGM